MKKTLLKVMAFLPIGFFTQLNAQYCVPTYTTGCTSGDDIDDFILYNSGINHLGSGCSANAYGDFTADPTLEGDLEATVTYNFEATHNFGNQYIRVYIDFNNNDDFEDPGELLFTSATGEAITTGSISIPAGATPTTTRMRIIGRYAGAPTNSCTSGATWGETHDYTVNILPAPTCPAPINIVDNSITSTDAEIGWTSQGSETNWNIEYGAPGYTPGTGTNMATTNNPETIGGLTPSTTYDVYVQADCGGTDTSTWSGPYTITTNCVPETAPYLEAFTTGALPNCWDNVSSNSGSVNGLWKFTGTPGYGAAANGRPAGSFAWTDGSTPVVADITLLSPLIDMSALTVPTLSFDWFSNNTDNPGDNVPLIVDINDGSGWTNLTTFSGDSPDWKEAELVLDSYVGQTVQFRFICDQTVTSGLAQYNDILLDSVMVDEAPSCPRPFGLNVSNITANDAELDWSAGYQETEWVIEYDVAGFTQGTGTTIVTNNLNETLTALSAITDYDVYVKGVCGVGDSSEWVGPASFTTPCVVFSAPFHEPFDNGVEPDCWENLATGTAATDFWKFNGVVGYEAANNGKPEDTYAWSDGSGVEPEGTLITPYIDVTTINDPYLTFEWFSNNGTNPGDNVELYIEINGGSVWETLDTLSGDSTEWMYEAYDLSAYEDSTVRIRFVTDHTATSSSAFYNDILLDEVRVWSCIREAGTDDASDVCRLDELVDLNSIITIDTEDGRWEFPTSQGLVVDDTMLNIQTLPQGDYEVYYITKGACQEDTAVATVSVYPPSTAGQSEDLEVCMNEPINLFDGLSGNVDHGGTWYDSSDDPIAGSQQNASNFPGDYNYDYIVSNGVCPADTSLVTVTVADTCDYLSLGEEKLTDLSVYPNPATDMINISNPTDSESLRIEMLDMNGRVVVSDADALSNTSEATIAIDHLQKGIYTLRIYNDESQRTFKVVKQ
ncbi:MAG: GEVED domain-containing protein [Brumimicrobium sp.]